MKSQHTNLKTIATLLSLVVILQGCRIYHPENVPIQKAANTNKAVKLILNDNEPYYFEYIKKKGELYTATAQSNSATAEYLEMQGFNIVERDRTSTTFELPITKVKSVHEKNQSSSTLLTVLIGLGLVGGLVYLGYSNMNISPW